MATRVLFLLATFGLGCGGGKKARSTAPGPDAGADAANCIDEDGDGWGDGCANGPDCDDANPDWTDVCPDCDADPKAVGCPCEAGEPETCYDGPVEVIGIGVCVGGLRSCDDGAWTDCEGQVVPSDEAEHGPNGLDDDCDGLFDDGLCGDTEACAGSCCLDGQDCLGAYCADPAPCTTDADCDDDTRCTDGACRPWGEGEAWDECPGAPLDPDALGPEVACAWTGGIPWVTPLVVDLDGGAAGEESAEIIFTAWGDGLSVLFGGGLIVLDGRDCTERWRKNDPEIDMYSPVAVGDIDGDGDLEIAARTPGRDFSDYGGLAIFDKDGNVVCESPMYAPGYDGASPLAIANLDGVGDAEVVMGMKAYDSDCQVIWNRRPDLWPLGSLVSIADADLDDDLEVFTGNRIVRGADGTVEANFEALVLDDGYTAVADFDPVTPEAEIAVVAPTGVRIQTIAGEVIFGPWDEMPSNTFFGGPPTVADFDGDGQAEFGALGTTHYVVFDPDCEDGWARDGGLCDGGSDGVLWRQSTESTARGATSGTAFDLNGDGPLEVVVTDECFLRAYDGATGATRFALPNPSAMQFESPTVADADGDGYADIIASNQAHGYRCGADDPDTGAAYADIEAGVRVFHHVDERWARARPMWNQHAYSITNVEDDGAIPAVPSRHWEIDGENAFRANIGPVPALIGADLTVRGEGPDLDACPDSLALSANVANRGAREADAPVMVAFYDGDPAAGGALICQASTLAPIDPGATERVSCDWIGPPIVPTDVYVVVDPTDTAPECIEENGSARIPQVRCPSIE